MDVETGPALAERIADWLTCLDAARLPAPVVATSRRLLLDVAGLCVAARQLDYVQATRGALDAGGACTALGHAGGWSGFDAALLNGTAAHGEDYDDTFEGGPVHSGAVLVPALLAAGERERLDGAAVLRGLAGGSEILCRMSTVSPKAIHKAGFHPTAVIGAVAAAASVAVALGLPRDQVASAIGIAGSMASGIIEYLAEGTWTKRMHAGWAAQSGLRAALMARGGFLGPRTVLEGTHGFYHGFAASVTPDFAQLMDGLGDRWVMADIAFKPYACGTMTQPYIDCAVALRNRGIAPAAIERITCKVGEGTVHRLWEPLAVKHRPPTPYAAKFSTPFCIAAGLIDGRAGFGQFTEARTQDPALLDLAGRVSYVIDPANAYPRNFTGHIRAEMRDGSVEEVEQPYMRGGARDPMPDAELEEKFMDNCAYGGWDASRAARLRDVLAGLFEARDLSALAEFRA